MSERTDDLNIRAHAHALDFRAGSIFVVDLEALTVIRDWMSDAATEEEVEGLKRLLTGGRPWGDD